MNAHVKWLQSHPLPLFFALALGLGWLLTLALRALPATPLLLPLLALPISLAPAGVAWLLVLGPIGVGSSTKPQPADSSGTNNCTSGRKHLM